MKNEVEGKLFFTSKNGVEWGLINKQIQLCNGGTRITVKQSDFDGAYKELYGEGKLQDLNQELTTAHNEVSDLLEINNGLNLKVQALKGEAEDLKQKLAEPVIPFIPGEKLQPEIPGEGSNAETNPHKGDEFNPTELSEQPKIVPAKKKRGRKNKTGGK